MASERTSLLYEQLKKRILILDGAMGTMLQSFSLEEKDFRTGAFENHPVPLKGDNDVLSLTRPDAVAAVHKLYLEAGADIIETNSFNANAISQKEYGLEGRAYDMARASAAVARAVADSFTEQTPSKPRFVAGSIGSTSKSLSMPSNADDTAERDVDFDELVEAYLPCIKGLIDGGADVLLVETIFDGLNAKAAAYAIEKAETELASDLPVMFSMTLSDASGRILAGQTPEAFMISLAHTKNVMSFGFNCAMGAEELRPHVEDLAAKAPFLISAHPNAGLPDENGKYVQTPEKMAEEMKSMAEAGLLNVAGGCCGTNPDHIRAIAKALYGIKPRVKQERKHRLELAGLEALTSNPAVPFINVGERTNVAGSRKFLRLIKENKLSEALQIAVDQVRNGALIIDVNMDDPMLDAKKEMKRFLLAAAAEPDIAKVPVMIDSSNWEVVRTALKCVQGKAVVNSISLKEGEEEFLKKAREIRSLGGAVLAMAFDEEGQANTLERRVAVCRRMYKLLTEKAFFRPDDVIFDPNVFAIATGMAEHDNYAKDFIEAVRTIRQEMPFVHASGGISNVSFSFRGNDKVRSAIHAVFLYHAVKAGLDVGIVNPAQLVCVDALGEKLRQAAEDVVLNKGGDAVERLLKEACNDDAGNEDAEKAEDRKLVPVEKRLAKALVSGDERFLEEDVIEALKKYSSAVKVVEEPLMDGMKEAGRLFAEGKMFLPQVVKTARVMKNAVAILQPHLAKGEEEGSSAGTIVLATVKGDVHDIGKNIVGVVLKCNGFKVVDLGVMVPAEKIVEAAKAEHASAVGLSGLITPSLAEMVNTVKAMKKAGLTIPVFTGGAAASELHTALKIQSEYDGPVVYTRDASQTAPALLELLSKEKRDDFLKRLASRRAELVNAADKAKSERKSSDKEITHFKDAQKNSFVCDFIKNKPFEPAEKGFIDAEETPENLAAFIDWQAFTAAWRLANANDKEKRDLISDGCEMLKVFQSRNVKVKARGRIFRASSTIYGINVFDGDGKLLRFLPTLRRETPDERLNGSCPSLADFIAPETSGIPDYVGMAVITSGNEVKTLAEEFAKNNDPYRSLLAATVGNFLAEAMSEKFHADVRRKYWGYAKDETLTLGELFSSKYCGIRPAPGYPVLPDHTVKKDIFELLGITEDFGVKLTESYMMVPEASACCLYFASPEARYFDTGKISDEQLDEYAEKKRMTKDELAKFIKPL